MHSGQSSASNVLQDAEGRALWDMTWHKARSISSGLSPQLLVNSGLDRPERAEPKGAATSGPSPGPPPNSPSPVTQQGSSGSPSATPMQHPPLSIAEEERSSPQAAAAIPSAAGTVPPTYSNDQRVYHPQPQLGANPESSSAFAAEQPSSSFSGGPGPQAGFGHTDRQPDAFSSATDQAGGIADQQAVSEPNQLGASDQLPGPPQESSSQYTATSESFGQAPGQFSSQDSQNPAAPQLNRLSPSVKATSHNAMSSEPSSHKLSALEERYAMGVPVTADEAFNRALQQQHHRQNSWGSNTSTSSLAAPAPSASAATAASGGVSDGVSTSRLLATIHSGIPSTDDDGPLFAELGKMVAEEEAEAAGQGRGQDPGQFTAGSQERQNPDMDLSQVGH